MKTKTIKAYCIDLYIAIWIENDVIEAKYAQNPTKENKVRMVAVHRKMLHYKVITRGKSMLDYLN